MTPAFRPKPLGHVVAFVFYQTGDFVEFGAENGKWFKLVEIGLNLVIFDPNILSKYESEFDFYFCCGHPHGQSFPANLTLA